ncbi:MAG: cupin domain-containing protein [Planctomycetota bacterium]|jgi:predicted cupin superfamily sugar epimerase
MTAEQVIELLGMKPLPEEGGYYVETYRCKEKLTDPPLPAGRAGQRSLCTAILYLLTPDTFSALHRLKSDEVFHFHLGNPVTMLQLHPNKSSEVITLGPDILNGQRVQVTVPGNSWQGCFLNESGEFALMGCTVSPGFALEDFELARLNDIVGQYPDQKDLIVRLTRRD